VTACVKAGQVPPKNWTTPNRDIREVFSPTTREITESQSSVRGYRDGGVYLTMNRRRRKTLNRQSNPHLSTLRKRIPCPSESVHQGQPRRVCQALCRVCASRGQESNLMELWQSSGDGAEHLDSREAESHDLPAMFVHPFSSTSPAETHAMVWSNCFC
jgi:hypothetical protein